MRNGFLIVFAFTVIAHCAHSPADDPTFATTSETEASLKALVERLEVRVTDLESELARLKHIQREAVIGGSLLDHVEEPTDQSPVRHPRPPFLLANGSTCVGVMHVDRSGIIRDASGTPMGYWGFEYNFGGISIRR